MTINESNIIVVHGMNIDCVVEDVDHYAVLSAVHYINNFYIF